MPERWNEPPLDIGCNLIPTLIAGVMAQPCLSAPGRPANGYTASIFWFPLNAGGTVFTRLHSIDIMQKLEKVGKLPLKVVSIGWTLRHSWVQSSNDWNIKVFYPPSPYTATWFIGCFNPIFFGLWFRLRNAWLKEFSAYYSFYNCPQQYLSSQMSHKHCLRKSF